MLDTLNRVCLLRFDASLDERAVRDACRELIGAYPRVRAVLEPVVGAWRLRVLDVCDLVDVLFDDAFRLYRGFPLRDPAAVLRRLHTISSTKQARHRVMGRRAYAWPVQQREDTDENSLDALLGHLDGVLVEWTADYRVPAAAAGEATIR